MDATTTTVTATAAAPAAELPAAPKPSDQSLTLRQRARRFAAVRAAAAKGGSNGQPVSPSTPAQPAPAVAQQQPKEPDQREDDSAPPIDPTSSTPPVPSVEAGTPEVDEPSDNPLALLEDLEGGGVDEAQTENWLRELDELLKTGDQPKAIKALQKRLHDIVDQRDTERNARLEAERRLAERPETVEESPQQANVGHPAINALDQQINQTFTAIELVEKHIDAIRAAEGQGVDVPQHVILANGQPWTDASGRPIIVTAEKARSLVRQYESQLSSLTARRETTLAQLQQDLRAAERQTLGEAVKHYPWLGNKTAPEFIEASALLKQRPGLRQDPNWPLIVGDYITGKRMREKAGLPATAPALTRPKGGSTPPPVVTQRAAAPPPGSDLDKQVQEARAAYQKDGTAKNRAKLFALQRQQRNAA